MYKAGLDEYAFLIRGLLPGSLLNIEVDVLAKYAERRQSEPKEFLTEESLIANGY